jgi:ubiquitin C-terminal hydrolase
VVRVVSCAVYSRFCEQDADAPQVSMKYDLVSVVNHIGGISGGHYIAYALNDEDGKWYEFDDSWATAVSEDTVRNKEVRRTSVHNTHTRLIW